MERAQVRVRHQTNLFRTHFKDHDCGAAVLLAHLATLSFKSIHRPLRSTLCLRDLAPFHIARVARQARKLPSLRPVDLILAAHLLDVHSRLGYLRVLGDCGDDLEQHPKEECRVLEALTKPRDDAIRVHELVVVPVTREASRPHGPKLWAT
eukprot:4608871-Prymnesium_polylepis.3